MDHETGSSTARTDANQDARTTLPQDKCLLEFGDSMRIMMGGQFIYLYRKSTGGELGRLGLGACRPLGQQQRVVGKTVWTVIRHKNGPLRAGLLRQDRDADAPSGDDAVKARCKSPAMWGIAGPWGHLAPAARAWARVTGAHSSTPGYIRNVAAGAALSGLGWLI